MKIIDIIPYGKENAVTRDYLNKKTGIPDRDIRDAIKQANKELEQFGEAILSSSGSRGYWRTNDIAEMQRYLAESRHRCKSTAQNDEPIRRIVAQKTGQKMIYVPGYYRHIRQKG